MTNTNQSPHIQVAHLQKQGHYLTAKDNQVVAIHPSSVLDNKPAVSTKMSILFVSRHNIRLCRSLVIGLTPLRPSIFCYFSQWILFQDFVLTTKNFVRSCTAVRVEWLVELAPHYFDLDNWPEGETKGELERAYRRLQQEREYIAGKKK